MDERRPRPDDGRVSDDRATNGPDTADREQRASDRPPPRRLTRSRRDRVIAGVAGGLGDYFRVDPVVFRIGFVAATILGGSGILLYLVGWLVLPEERSRHSVGHDIVRRTSPATVGILLVVVGAAFLIHDLALWGPRRLLLSLVLLGAGAALLWWRPGDEAPTDEGEPLPGDGTPPGGETWTGEGGRAPREGAPSGDDAPPDDEEPTVAEEDPPAAGVPTAETTRPGFVPSADDPAGGEQPPPPEAPPSPAAPPPSPRPGEPRHRRRSRRSPLGRVTISLVLILGGLAGLADAADVVDVSVAGFLAVSLVVVGLGLVVGAWWGRARWLIVPGVLLTLALGAAAVVDVPFEGGVGERTHRPVDIAEVEREYRLFAGEMLLDLRGVDFPPGVTKVDVSVAFGQLRVLVPDDVTVVATASVSAGELRLLGDADEGLRADGRRVVRGPRGSGTLRLDATVGAGEIEVTRA